MSLRLLLSIILWAVILEVAAAHAHQIEVISWNMESGGADQTVLSEQIENFQGIDIWGFSEVKNMEWVHTFTEAAAEGEGGTFRMIPGSTGGGDKLLIVYNADVFEEIRHFELHDINPLGRVRAPLVAHLRDKQTQQEFLFMVNHLYRSRADKRHEQSQALNEWAQHQTLPVIAVGDYNYDWSVENGEGDHDQGFDLLTAQSVFSWVQPSSLLKTQCSRFNSVLDFVFVTQGASTWNPSSTIEFANLDYCPDSDSTSDHRPVKAIFQLRDEETGPDDIRNSLLRRMTAIETELQELRRLVESLPVN